MRLSRLLCRNLNAKFWDRRIWEIGYRGPQLPQKKSTGRPDFPISDNAIRLLQQRLALEYEVMKALATPYLTKVTESAYIAKYGNFEEQLAHKKEMADYKRMPGEAKKVTGYKCVDRLHANIGNLLHEDRTVESSLERIIVNKKEWD
uniref:Uncharacterized protein n=1 Tax=Syphacia muris TaxID=451379 RepID=A0A0N5AIX4_9BILA